MASISYEHNTFEFRRESLSPVSEAEYALIRKNYDSFLEDFFKKANEEYNSMPNPNRFNWKMFLILLGAGIVFLGFDFGLKALGYEDAGEIFAMLSFIPFLAIVIQPFQWLMAEAKTGGVMARYKVVAEHYFDFHSSKIKLSKNHVEYLTVLQTTTLRDFDNFEWTN
jgi:hypothetical protein